MERFTSKYKIVNSGCWEWQASLRGKSGYGAFKHKGKVVDAHRMSYLLYKGEITEGMMVCHKCDNRKCINPDHLFLGTAKDNHADAVAKGRITFPKSKSYKKHPSITAWDRGCRCDDCRAIRNTCVRNYIQRKKQNSSGKA